MQTVGCARSFNSRDTVAFVHRGKRQAGVEPTPVDHQRACAALPVIAAFFRAGEMKVLAERVEKGRTRINYQRARFAIHNEADRGKKASRLRRRNVGQSAGFSRAIAGAARAARVVAPTIIRSRRLTLKDSELLTADRSTYALCSPPGRA
jgi:hypothetical protein